MTESTVLAKFRIRRDTAANWTSVNPVLELGEPGLETDTRLVKYGDGATDWVHLAYQAGTGGGGGTQVRYDIVSATAANDISGHSAVFIDIDGKAHLAQPDLTSRLVAGVTTGGVSSGASVAVQISNVLYEPSWSWASGLPVWLGPNGALTQALPTSGALFQVGIPVGSNGLKIEPQIIAVIS